MGSRRVLRRGQTPRRGWFNALERLERRDCPAVVSVVGLGNDTPDVEIAENGLPVAVTISLSEAVRRPVQVSYLLSGVGTAKATPRTDVRISSGTRSLGNPTGTLTFRPGQTSQQILLAAVNDASREGVEELRIQLFRPRNCTIDPAATAIPVTILDDDGYTAALVVDGAARVAEGQPVRAAIQLSSPAVRTEVFYVATTEGTATERDYRPFQDLPVTILAGQTRSQPFTVNTVVDDDDTETDEFFILTAKHKDASFPPIDLVGVTIEGNGPAPPPGLTVADVTVAEGNQGRKSFAFTIRLSTPSLQPVSVHYATADGSATAGEDYDATSGSLTFQPGQISKTAIVSVIGDTRQEEDETFQLVLSSPSGADISMGTATATILDDDTDPVSSFQIVVTFSDNSLTTAQKGVFQLAAERWSEIITGDLSDTTFQGRIIDDVEISASGPFIDGPGRTLGRAGPEQLRNSGSRLPFTGVMEFDSADLAKMETDGTLYGVILHEMGHVLGLGTLWDRKKLIAAAGTGDPRYQGENALREYRLLAGNPAATSIPVENTGGPGTADGHWRDSVFKTELMTGYAEPRGVAMPISRMTVGALEDLGYTVNYAAADSYTLPVDLQSSAATVSSTTASSRLMAMKSLQPSFFAALSVLFVDAGPATGRPRACAIFTKK